MSGQPDSEAVARIRALHEARTRAELAAADALCPGADAIAYRGELLAPVIVVKGLPGPAEAAGGSAVSGSDGEAIGRALETLGWPERVAFFTLSHPEPGLEGPACGDRIRAQVEAVDPQVVIALDDVAAADLSSGYGIGALAPGVEVRVTGRRLVALSGFEASLADESRKKVVWRELQAAKPAGPVY